MCRSALLFKGVKYFSPQRGKTFVAVCAPKCKSIMCFLDMIFPIKTILKPLVANGTGKTDMIGVVLR